MCAHKIVDITTGDEYRRYLHKCMVGPPSKRYKKRIEYFERAIPNGFHKRLLISNGDIVGQIEYAPAEASYYPIRGNHTIVMNCIWVLRRVRGPNFGKKLLAE